MGRKLDRGIESESPRVRYVKRLDGAEVEVRNSVSTGNGSPRLRGLKRARQEIDLVDKNHRLAGDEDVAWILEDRDNVEDESLITFVGVLLGQEDLVFRSIPATRPILIGPTNAKRKIGCPERQDLLEWALEELAAVEPVVVVAEAVDTVTLCKCRLLFTHLWNPEIVESEIRWQMWLIMSTV
jgi:hypothetical protein